MWDVIVLIIGDVVGILNIFIPLVLVLNLCASMLWGRGD